tara:strand:+ start:172 stop:339 length:168 start_codon:yes stop_codon:yes gene_type:complete
MFKLNRKYATIKEVADIIKVIGTIMDTISKPILKNIEDTKKLEARIKLLEMKHDK